MEAGWELISLQEAPSFAKACAEVRRFMANRAIWNVRKRHEWLGSKLKKKHLKRRKRLRIGLEQALERKRGEAPAAEADAAPQA
jgi:hypothetical protein